jgi:hypothetical protein
MRNTNRRRVLIAALLSVFAQMVHAQAELLPPQWLAWQGKYTLLKGSYGSCGITQQQGTEWDRTLQRITLAISQSIGPVYPHAYPWAVGVSAPEDHSETTCERNPITGGIDILISSESQVTLPTGATGRPKRKPATEGGAGGFYMFVNRLPRLAFDGVLGEDRSGMGFYRQTGTYQGYPVIAKTQIVVTAPGHAPAVVPVSIDRALKWLLPIEKEDVASKEKELARVAQESPSRQFDEMVESLRSAGQAKEVEAAQEQMRAMKAQFMESAERDIKNRRAELDASKAALGKLQELAKLSATQRAEPAYLRFADDHFRIYTNAQDGGEPLLMPNPQYFDSHLVRTVPQILLVMLDPYDGDLLASDDRVEHDPHAEWLRAFFLKIDWKAIAKSELR